MNEPLAYGALLGIWFALAAISFGFLLIVPAPYGRHSRRGWGPRIPAATGWFFMELPAVVVFALIFALGDRWVVSPYLLFLGLWQLHYVHRVFVFPLRRRGSGQNVPLLIVAFGLVFNVVNGYLNARYLFVLGPTYSHDWTGDPRFVGGAAIFLAGFLLNVLADSTLLRIRRHADADYSIPRGVLFRYVSCPNYLGEITQWTGWAVLTWSWPGLAFAVWTAANLVPRALAHHRWYRDRFPDYPERRRALVPFVL